MRMVMAVREEVDEYAAIIDPGFAREVLEHAVEHVQAFVRAGRAGAPAGAARSWTSCAPAARSAPAICGRSTRCWRPT